MPKTCKRVGTETTLTDMKNASMDTAGLVGLTRDEMISCHGGLVFWAAVGAGVCISAFTEIITDWDNFKAGLSGACKR